ncbi:MAG: amidohydrolase family protein [Candidatus Bipolaricaulota bacterium]
MKNAATRVALCGATVIDGVGEVPLEDRVVVIEGDSIAAVGPREDARVRSLLRGAEVHELHGMTLMPGLIDCHVHLCLRGVRGPDLQLQPPEKTALDALFNAQQQLKHGVTTVRDLGGIGHIDIALREAIARGDVLGPRVIASGEYIRMTGGHGSVSSVRADGVAEALRVTRRQLEAGADWIKIMASGGQSRPNETPTDPEFTREELRAIITEALDHSRPVAVHEHGSKQLKDTLLSGVRTLEHGTYLDQEVVDIMAERQVALCPTGLAYYKQATNENGDVPAWKADRAKVIWAAKQDSIRRALRAGVRVIAGSDSCFTVSHGEGGREIAVLVELGLSSMGAVKAATSVAAEVLGLTEVAGRVEPGLKADLIVIQGDPLQDLAVLGRAPWGIVQGGTMRKWPGLARFGQPAQGPRRRGAP